MLRLTWADVNFEADTVTARSRKQSMSKAESVRHIDLHPELKAVLLDWRAARGQGQYVVCDDGSLAPLTRNQAEGRFWQPLRGTDWVIPARSHRPKIGYHTYRHSFVSNLAAAGVDQRVIDAFVGHTTEAMRQWYRHLFPAQKRAAIRAFSLLTAEPPAHA